jgi:hypothetical protein
MSLKDLGQSALSADLLALFLAAELIDEVNGLGLAKLVLNGAALFVNLLKGNVLDTDGNESLLITNTKVELFFLVDLDYVKVPTARTASQVVMGVPPWFWALEVVAAGESGITYRVSWGIDTAKTPEPPKTV